MGLFIQHSVLRPSHETGITRIRNLYKTGRRQGRLRVEKTGVPYASFETVSFLLRAMKLYVSNPQKWLEFFERVSSGKTHLSQTGTGRRPRVIAVDQSKPFVKAILPAEQTTAQAKSELEREGINPSDVASALQSSTERGRKRKSQSARVGKNKKAKTNNTSKAKKSKGQIVKTKRQDFKDIFKIE